MSGKGSVHQRFQAILADTATRERLLPPLARTELVAIKAMTDEVLTDVRLWSQGKSSINTLMLPLLTLVNIVQSPGASIKAVATRVKLSTWVAAVDDLFDESSADFAVLERVVGDCFAVAVAPPRVAADPTTDHGRMLATILNELAEYPCWPTFHPLWSGLLVRFFDGMVYEYWLERQSIRSGPHLARSFEEYLFHARHTVGAPLVWSTSLATETAGGNQGSVAPRLAFLEGCGTALRLANDLATPPSAYRNGRIDAVRIQASMVHSDRETMANHDTLRASRTIVADLLMAELQSLASMLKATAYRDPMAARFLRVTQFVSELYRRADVRDLALEFLA